VAAKLRDQECWPEFMADLHLPLPASLGRARVLLLGWRVKPPAPQEAAGLLWLQMSSRAADVQLSAWCASARGLVVLDLCGCVNLRSLPESLGQLTALQHLNLTRCSRLASLPESLGRLTALQRLDLPHCWELVSLPESLGQLSALQHLDLYNCGSLASLPESFGQLSALQHLDLSWCCGLASLPDSFGQLTALQHLHMRECSWLWKRRAATREMNVIISVSC
jgi:hypothetical protein